MQAGTAGASAEKGIKSTAAKTPMVSQFIASHPAMSCSVGLFQSLSNVGDLSVACKQADIEAFAALHSSATTLNDLSQAKHEGMMVNISH